MWLSDGKFPWQICARHRLSPPQSLLHWISFLPPPCLWWGHGHWGHKCLDFYTGELFQHDPPIGRSEAKAPTFEFNKTQFNKHQSEDVIFQPLCWINTREADNSHGRSCLEVVLIGQGEKYRLVKVLNGSIRELTLKRTGNTRKAFHSTRGEASLMEEEMREWNFQSRDMRREVASQAEEPHSTEKRNSSPGSQGSFGECKARRQRRIWERGHRDQVLEGLLGHEWGLDFILEGMRPPKGFPERGVASMSGSQLPLPWAKPCSSLTLHSHHVEKGIIIMCTSHLQKQGL